MWVRERERERERERFTCLCCCYKAVMVLSQVTVNELFKDVTYQPVLVRAHSCSPLSPVPVSESNRLSPLAIPPLDCDSIKVKPTDVIT